MNCEAMNSLFANWKYPDNHKAKIRSWIADIVEGNPVTELHNKGFALSSVNGFVILFAYCLLIGCWRF